MPLPFDYLDARNMTFALQLKVKFVEDVQQQLLEGAMQCNGPRRLGWGWPGHGHSRSLLAWRFLVIRTLGFSFSGEGQTNRLSSLSGQSFSE
jgi:hypothetical protein